MSRTRLPIFLSREPSIRVVLEICSQFVPSSPHKGTCRPEVTTAFRDIPAPITGSQRLATRLFSRGFGKYFKCWLKETSLFSKDLAPIHDVSGRNGGYSTFPRSSWSMVFRRPSSPLPLFPSSNRSIAGVAWRFPNVRASNEGSPRPRVARAEGIARPAPSFRPTDTLTLDTLSQPHSSPYRGSPRPLRPISRLPLGHLLMGGFIDCVGKGVVELFT